VVLCNWTGFGTDRKHHIAQPHEAQPTPLSHVDLDQDAAFFVRKAPAFRYLHVSRGHMQYNLLLVLNLFVEPNTDPLLSPVDMPALRTFRSSQVETGYPFGISLLQ